MKFLITGGAGYIGSHAVRMLLDQDNDVVIIDDLSTGFKVAIDSRATFYQLDIHQTKAVEEVLKKEHIQVVMHFAAFSLVGESVKNPLKYYRNNVEGTRSLLEAMDNAGVKQMIFSSTAAVYGESSKIPIDEDVDLLPTNPYGQTKMAIEQMLKAFSVANPSFHYVSLRYFNVAGAHHSGEIGENHQPETHLIPNVIKSVLDGNSDLKVFGDDYDTKDGSAVRDYIHVEDLIDAHIKAYEYIEENDESNVFNLGTASGYSVLDIIHTCEDIIGEKIPYQIAPRRAGDPAVLVASYDKANRELGWSPKRDLKTIIQSAYQYFKRGD